MYSEYHEKATIDMAVSFWVKMFKLTRQGSRQSKTWDGMLSLCTTKNLCQQTNKQWDVTKKRVKITMKEKMKKKV